MKYKKPEVLEIASALNAVSSTNEKLGLHLDVNTYSTSPAYEANE
jgi:hypothetical protein